MTGTAQVSPGERKAGQGFGATKSPVVASAVSASDAAVGLPTSTVRGALSPPTVTVPKSMAMVAPPPTTSTALGIDCAGR